MRFLRGGSGSESEMMFGGGVRARMRWGGSERERRWGGSEPEVLLEGVRARIAFGVIRARNGGSELQMGYDGCRCHIVQARAELANSEKRPEFCMQSQWNPCRPI